MTTQPESGTAKYLRDLVTEINEMRTGNHRKTVEEYVLTNGRLFTSEPLEADALQLLQGTRWKYHRPRECYMNAQRSALTQAFTEEAGTRLAYVEGYVITNTPFPIPHAWTSLDGRVVDTTLRNPRNQRDRIFGTIPERWEYFGVEMDPKECLHILKHQAYVPLIDDFQCGWPLLHRETEQQAQATPTR